MSWYCDVAPGHPVHAPYHDDEYGFPVTDDRVLFERLSLEIFQAGLSWLIVLKKREALRAAFEGFDPARVAVYGAVETARLLADPAIIRNRRKIAAVIANAARVTAIIAAEGSFAAWILRHHPRPLESWVALFRSRFAFMGVEVVKEFLMSIAILPGAHRDDCPVQGRILLCRPAWAEDGSETAMARSDA